MTSPWISRLLVAGVGLVSTLAVGCGDDERCLIGRCDEPASSGGAGRGAEATAEAPLCTSTGRERLGLGKAKLGVGRVAEPHGADRGRMKPYSALLTEYARVLGEDNAPDLVRSSGATFGEPAERTFLEPEPNAVSLFTAYRVAFEGCLRVTGALPNAKGQTAGDAKYAAAPTADTARAECSAWAHRFWSRAATPDEVNACVEVAMVESLKEDQTNGSAPVATTPVRRWAYACASVLTATGFLTY